MPGNRIERTKPGGTLTRDGFIPHYLHVSGARYAVKVCWCDSHKLPAPVRRNGRLVYMLPGGGEFQPDTDADYRAAMRVDL